MNTNITTKHPFTLAQWKELTTEQRQVLEAVAGYLSDRSLEKTTLTDEEISSTFGLMRSCESCVPSEYAGEDLLSSIRRKFGAVYEVGLEMAEAELREKKTTTFNFCLLMDPVYEDSTHVAILDYDRPVCYLHEWTKAWHLGFTTLADLANTVLQVKKCLVEKVAAYATREIFVIMEGGAVHEIVNLPPNINVTVLNYNTEGVEKNRLGISPVDGKACVINKW